MQPDRNFEQLISRMEANSRKQVTYARIQCIFSFLAAICCIALLVLGLSILPRFYAVAEQADVVLGNLQAVTSELAELDLSGMVNHIDELVTNVDGLVTSSQGSMEAAMEKINAIDFEALNKAIKDLSDVIEPIADFFNTFKK